MDKGSHAGGTEWRGPLGPRGRGGSEKGEQRSEDDLPHGSCTVSAPFQGTLEIQFFHVQPYKPNQTAGDPKPL